MMPAVAGMDTTMGYDFNDEAIPAGLTRKDLMNMGLIEFDQDEMDAFIDFENFEEEKDNEIAQMKANEGKGKNSSTDDYGMGPAAGDYNNYGDEEYGAYGDEYGAYGDEFDMHTPEFYSGGSLEVQIANMMYHKMMEH
jgi:hypothetical protein